MSFESSKPLGPHKFDENFMSMFSQMLQNQQSKPMVLHGPEKQLFDIYTKFMPEEKAVNCAKFKRI